MDALLFLNRQFHIVRQKNRPKSSINFLHFTPSALAGQYKCKLLHIFLLRVKMMAMPTRRNITIIVIISAAVACAVFFAIKFHPPKKEAPAEWNVNFSSAVADKKVEIPANWVLKEKPGTKPAAFSLTRDSGSAPYVLHMEADTASASLVSKADSVDLQKTPIIRWRWRATTLPEGADGRVKSKDDQAIGIYVGTGTPLSNKSVSYRWDTETPKEATGNCVYGLGILKIKWHTLRNKEDAVGEWITEERNVAEDFKNAWGFYPDNVYLSVSCNSQYTKSKAGADLAWIEFAPAQSAKVH
jgi:hypothetical protein